MFYNIPHILFLLRKNSQKTTLKTTKFPTYKICSFNVFFQFLYFLEIRTEFNFLNLISLMVV